jgi:hypothetical protein
MVNTTTVDLAASLTVMDDSPDLDSPEANELLGAIAAQQGAALDLDLDAEDDDDEDEADEASVTTAAPLGDLDEEDEAPRGPSPALAAAMASWRIDA